MSKISNFKTNLTNHIHDSIQLFLLVLNNSQFFEVEMYNWTGIDNAPVIFLQFFCKIKFSKYQTKSNQHLNKFTFLLSSSFVSSEIIDLCLQLVQKFARPVKFFHKPVFIFHVGLGHFLRVDGFLTITWTIATWAWDEILFLGIRFHHFRVYGTHLIWKEVDKNDLTW